MTVSTIKLDTAEDLAYWLRVKPATIRMWAWRGHITRYPGGLYSGAEILRWIDHGRDTRMDEVRRGVAQHA